MRFSTTFLCFLSTMAAASPAPAPDYKAPMYARDVTETDLIAETIIFGVEAAKCKILKCAKVIATGACILNSLPDVSSTLACVSGNADALCSCAGCVHELNDWLVKEGICDKL